MRQLAVSTDGGGMVRRVELCDYNTDWPVKYLEARDRVLAALGADFPIEHIGSTAVPGLAAKPVIDIMLGVPQLNEALDAFLKPLRGSGFQWMEAFIERFPKRLFFFCDNRVGQRTHNLHVVEAGGTEWRRHLVFRDYLRAHPEVAKEYEQLKRQLAPQFDDSIKYSDAKTPWIRGVEQRALDEVNGES